MSFGICVVKNPVYIFDERRQCEVILWNESEGDRVLDLEFDGFDFKELQSFLDLKLPPAKQREGENYGDYLTRLENEYAEAAKQKNFPMLGRIWDWYHCATYFSTEIKSLEEECRRIKNAAPNADLSKAMDKILFGCSEAAKTNSGLELASD